MPDPGFTNDQAIAAGGYLETSAYRCSLEITLLCGRGHPRHRTLLAIGTHAWAYWPAGIGQDDDRPRQARCAQRTAGHLVLRRPRDLRFHAW